MALLTSREANHHDRRDDPRPAPGCHGRHRWPIPDGAFGQLAPIREVLDRHAVRYWVDSDAISLDGKPAIAVINFGRAATQAMSKPSSTRPADQPVARMSLPDEIRELADLTLGRLDEARDLYRTPARRGESSSGSHMRAAPSGSSIRPPARRCRLRIWSRRHSDTSLSSLPSQLSRDFRCPRGLGPWSGPPVVDCLPRPIGNRV